MTNLELYHQHLTTIALTVSRKNRFQPCVYYRNDDTPLSFAVQDTVATDEYGDPVTVAEPTTFRETLDTAYRWTLVPEKCYGNDWRGVIG